MKKVYKIPQIHFESFEMTKTIASCTIPYNHTSPETCTKRKGEFTDINSCTEPVTLSATEVELSDCYDVPTPTSGPFSS